MLVEGKGKAAPSVAKDMNSRAEMLGKLNYPRGKWRRRAPTKSVKSQNFEMVVHPDKPGHITRPAPTIAGGERQAAVTHSNDEGSDLEKTKKIKKRRIGKNTQSRRSCVNVPAVPR